MKKKLVTGVFVIMVAMLSAICSGCGCENNTATPDEAITSVTESTENSSIVDTTLNEEEQAIVNTGLQVDDNGDIVDKDGNKLEADENGEVEVKTDDGKTIKVSEETVKTENKGKGTTNTNTSTEKKNTSNNTTSSKSSTSTSTGKSTSTSNTSKGSTTNTSSSKTTNSKTTTTNTSSNTNSKTSGTTSSKTSSNTNGNSNAGKTWHEAVYKEIYHEAEYETVYVVDTPAYSYEEDIYEEKWRTICNTCGADITDCNDGSHGKSHVFNGENFSYSNKRIQVKTGTKTVTVPEEGHWETKTVKEAWTEKVLVKEAGWY